MKRSLEVKKYSDGLGSGASAPPLFIWEITGSMGFRPCGSPKEELCALIPLASVRMVGVAKPRGCSAHSTVWDSVK